MAANIDFYCKALREDIRGAKLRLSTLLKHPDLKQTDELAVGNIPMSRGANMAANLILAFRGLEEARMRLGKVLQAYNGGVSIFDKAQASPQTTTISADHPAVTKFGDGNEA